MVMGVWLLGHDSLGMRTRQLPVQSIVALVQPGPDTGRGMPGASCSFQEEPCC